MPEGRGDWQRVTRVALSLPATRLALIAGSVTALWMCRIPLLGVHGAESAVVLGAILPPFAAAAGARLVVAVRRGGRPVNGLDLGLGGLCVGLSVWSLPTALLALNAMRVKQCSPLEGVLFMILGPGAGILLATLVGVTMAAGVHRERTATWLAVLLPISGIALALRRFYATPAIFFYGHFFGFFPGSIYDELVGISEPLLTLRLLTLCIGVGLLGLLIAHYHPTRAALGRASRAPIWTGIAIIAAGVFLAGEQAAVQLGHTTTQSYIAEQLGNRVESERCELVVPREMHTSALRRMADDCDFRVRQMERWFGLHQPRKIRVYLFRSAEEKRELMGAASTNIAKPWRHDVYLQLENWPHPVLAHEIAHVVAGNAGSGPFRISGRLGGLWPDPNLIEGAAVAAAWADNGELTAHQWARAGLELGKAVDIEELTGAGFLTTQKRLAYMLSGSLLRYIADTHGIEALRRIYAGESLPQVLGMPVADLQRQWHSFLEGVALPASARALAELRFSGSSIFSAVCPHRVAQLRARLAADLRAGDDLRAQTTCSEILEADPAQSGTRAALTAILARVGDESRARAELAALVGPPAAEAALISAARQALADEEWRAGRLEEAQARYQALLRQPNGRDARRVLQVKRLAAEGSDRQAQLLFDMFVGEPGRRTDGATIVHIARELRTQRDDGLPHYLEARQLWARQHFEQAAPLLTEARALGLPSHDLWEEALRMEAMSLFGAGRPHRARNLFTRLARSEDAGLRAEARDWIARIDDAISRRNTVAAADATTD